MNRTRNTQARMFLNTMFKPCRVPVSPETKDAVDNHVATGAIRRPLWEYPDARGVMHIGWLADVSDFGGTDITYRFHDVLTGVVTLCSGSVLKSATRYYPAEKTK